MAMTILMILVLSFDFVNMFIRFVILIILPKKCDKCATDSKEQAADSRQQRKKRRTYVRAYYLNFAICSLLVVFVALLSRFVLYNLLLYKAKENAK